MTNLFDIKNVSCSYERNTNNPKIVLHIDELQIPQGEVVFIVGQSGCGKSTILETLGLMNNTIVPNAQTKLILSTKNNESIDYQQVWQKHNREIAKIRLNNFSFIFQQTNLMRNFNIYENIAITKMLQGASKKECRNSVRDIVAQVGLEDFITTKKIFGKAYEASGGQQQRIALARALVADYNVLFCDEPTGNLDPETANEVMAYMSSMIHKKENATTIIVSHDHNLATTYGDRIVKIFIEKSEHNGILYTRGHITKDSILIRDNNGWICNDKHLSTAETIDLIKKQ